MKDPDSQDDRYLKLTGKAEVPAELVMGVTYKVVLFGDIVAVTEVDRQDGGRVFSYKFQPIRVELIDHKGKSLARKDVRSMSQKLRASIAHFHKNNPEDPREAEDAYHDTMLTIITKYADRAYFEALEEFKSNDR